MNPPSTRQQRPGRISATRGILLAALLIGGTGLTASAPGPFPELPAQGEVIIDFNGHLDGTYAVHLFEHLGVHLPPHEFGGPFIEDAGALSFLIDSPPNLLSLNPLALGSPPGTVHASVGTYEFEFVDPQNRFAGSTTDFVEVTLVFVDEGSTVLTAWDADGEVLDEAILVKGFFDDFFRIHRLMVAAPGIARATVTTPLEDPTLGALMDTLVISPVPPAPHAPMEVAIGNPHRALIALGSELVTAIIYSTGALDTADLDPLKVLLEGVLPVRFARIDRNGDGAADLILRFPIALMPHLDRGRRTVTITAVDAAGGAWRADEDVSIVGRRRSGFGS